MENIVFYIKYKDNSAVLIESHWNGDSQRQRPLTTVSHLIGAYKTAVAPLLDHSSVAQLTLHAAVDAEALRPGLSLVDVASGHTDDNPLIIKSKNRKSLLNRNRCGLV